jgi:hypothetical protein
VVQFSTQLEARKRVPSSLSHGAAMPAFLCLCYQHQTVDCKKIA